MTGATCSLLGPFQVSTGEVPMSLPMGAQRVIALLALSGRHLLRRYVAEVLWPDSTCDRAAANLRSALWRLRQPGLELVECCGPQLGLAADVDVDLYRVQRQIDRILDDDQPTREEDQDIRPLCGDLLVGWYDDWALLERDRHLQRRLHALEALSARLITLGRMAAAVEAAHAAVSAEPLRETAHAALIEAYLAEGNRCAAVRQYDSCREILLQSMGLEPSPVVKALVAGLRSEDAVLVSAR